MTAYYPIMLKLSDQRIAVIGGGSIAARKIVGLLENGASHVRVIAPQLIEPLQLLADDGQIEWHAQVYEPTVLRMATLVLQLRMMQS